jgi:hypothetical protein
MAYLFPAMAKITPSFSEPELIVQYAQASGFMQTMEKGKLRIRMGQDDLAVYVNSLNIQTESVASQFGSNWLPSVSLQAEFEQALTYVLRNRNNYDDSMERAAARYNVSLPNALELGQRQGIYQQLRSMYWYGYNASNNEGLLNTQGATAVTLPADTGGNTSVTSYNPNDMYQFLLQQIVLMKSRMYQSGAQIANRIVFASPQREFLQFQYSSIVQVTSYQRPGGGTNTVAGAVQKIAEEAGDTIEWVYDDTLIGKGAGGTDMVVITIPEIEVPTMEDPNTNIFGKLQPSTKAVNVQYADVAAPIKVVTPIPDGGLTQMLEMRATAGWCWRPQGVTLVSMPY